MSSKIGTLQPRCTVQPPTKAQQCRDDWARLLALPVLRDEVARYSELVGACYVALDMDQSSCRYMCCKEAQERRRQRGYQVTRYIYATPSTGAGRSSCVGYVAVSTDEMTHRLGRRDVLVAFRGTVTGAEWAANLMSSLALVLFAPRPDVKVKSGFLDLYTASSGMMGSCQDQLLCEVSRVVSSSSSAHEKKKTKEEEDVSITLAGHSTGNALAMLLGFDLADLGLLNQHRGDILITVFSFGGPRVGNPAFKAGCDELGVKVLRVTNDVRDPVTILPSAFLKAILRRPRGSR